jgi:pimeloyl-ACP methyl ester carboxylesterase
MRLVLKCGRRVAVHRTTTRGAWFSAEERVVVFCHSDPGAGIFDPDPAVTREWNVRLLSVDRPGYGGSQPLATGTQPTVSHAADDLAVVLDSVGVERVGVVGWSAGGRVALALAARRPDLVDRVVVLAAQAPGTDAPPVAAPEDPRSGDALKLLGAGAADEDVLRADGVRGRLGDMLEAAFRQGVRGLATDLAASRRQAWDFDPEDVRADTLLLYGSGDRIADPRHGRWWQSRLPAAELEVVQGAGHLLVVPMWSRVLSHLVPESLEELSAA